MDRRVCFKYLPFVSDSQHCFLIRLTYILEFPFHDIFARNHRPLSHLNTICIEQIDLFTSWSLNSSFIKIVHALRNKKSLQIPRGNQNPQIEWQTTQWPKEKRQKDKQRTTKHIHKSKDRATRTPLKPGVNSCAQEG